MQLSLWLNAFIPRTVIGYTRVIPTGIHRVKTAVPLPALALLNPLNWKVHTDNGFLTDQRAFDPSPTASVRMRSRAVVELSPLSLVSQAHESSGTTQVDMVSGVVRGFAVADMFNCSFTAVAPTIRLAPTSPLLPSPSYPATSPNLTLRLSAEASDPLVSAACDIDYEGTFVIAPGTDTGIVRVNFDGLLDSFPAFECYASFNGVTKVLFTSPPPPGNTVTDLPGSANRPIAGSVSFP
jgi:hypothetical protein